MVYMNIPMTRAQIAQYNLAPRAKETETVLKHKNYVHADGKQMCNKKVKQSSRSSAASMQSTERGNREKVPSKNIYRLNSKESLKPFTSRTKLPEYNICKIQNPRFHRKSTEINLSISAICQTPGMLYFMGSQSWTRLNHWKTISA